MAGSPGDADRRLIALVLPPNEGFGPGRAGAVGMIAHRLARAARDGATPALDTIVLGAPQDGALFPDVPFHAVRPARFGFVRSARYANAMKAAIATLGPDLVEVYNRADLALRLAQGLPHIPVTLNLQNDPQAMRVAQTRKERRRLVAKLALVTANSRYTMGRMMQGVDPALARYAPEVMLNTLDPAELPEPAATRDKMILFAGRVVADKGADSFVRACALALPQLPGWRAEMIGGDRFGPDSPETSFIRALRPLAQAGGVTMHGYQPHAAVLDAMAHAAIVVVPSRWPEPFGLVALEAMALGAALITSHRGGLPEVGGEAARYADPDNPAALARAITELARDPPQCAAVAAACRLRALDFAMPPLAARLNSHRRALTTKVKTPSR